MNIEALNTIDFNALAADVYGNASTHGFHDEERNLPHWLCLVICELSEAVEADRKHSRAKLDAFSRAMKEPVCPHEGYNPEQIFDYWFRTYVKDTVEDELADTVIRLLDLGRLGTLRYWNLLNEGLHHRQDKKIEELRAEISWLRAEFRAATGNDINDIL